MSAPIPAAPGSGPGVRAVRLPAIAQRPRELAARLAAAHELDAGTSNVAIAEVLEIDESIVRKLRTGERRLSADHLICLSKRSRRQLFLGLEDADIPAVESDTNAA
jgi:hypothetical protein